MTLLSTLLFSLMSLIMGTSQEADILFAGDAMQHQGQLDAARRAVGVYDYTGCFDAVSTPLSHTPRLSETQDLT